MSTKEQEVLQTLLNQLEPVFERWYRGDPFGWLELMDDDMSYFSPFENELLDGKEAVVANVAPIEGQIHAPKFEVQTPALKLGEDIGILTYRLFEYNDADAIASGWKVTEVYKERGGQWRLIHSHFSPVPAPE